MFEPCFPKELAEDAHYVSTYIERARLSNSKEGYQHQRRYAWVLPGGERISFPSRIYYRDKFITTPSNLNPTQKLMYNCMFTRSHDGFLREKHIRVLLETEFPDWAIPYIVKICEEYVVEILEIVNEALKKRNTEKFRNFCAENLNMFLRGHDRMISYWNEYYRGRYPEIMDYVGYKLYQKHFGYKPEMELARNRAAKNVENLDAGADMGD